MINSSPKASDQTVDVAAIKSGSETSASNNTKKVSSNKSSKTNSVKKISQRDNGRGIKPSEPKNNSFESNPINGIALGMIETRGLVPSIEAADAMTKAAEVTLISREFVGGGYVAVMVRGETGAVNASVRAGADACERVGDGLVAAHIIARPHKEVEPVLRITKRVRRG